MYECDDEDCNVVVSLLVARYRAIRSEGYYLIAAVHEAVNRDLVVADEGPWLVIRGMTGNVE